MDGSPAALQDGAARAALVPLPSWGHWGVDGLGASWELAGMQLRAEGAVMLAVVESSWFWRGLGCTGCSGCPGCSGSTGQLYTQMAGLKFWSLSSIIPKRAVGGKGTDLNAETA